MTATAGAAINDAWEYEATDSAAVQGGPSSSNRLVPLDGESDGAVASASAPVYTAATPSAPEHEYSVAELELMEEIEAHEAQKKRYQLARIQKEKQR